MMENHIPSGVSDSSAPASGTPAAAPRPSGFPGWAGCSLAAAVAVAVFFLGILVASILQRRMEALRQPPLVPIDRLETDSSRWAANFPREYARYRMMADSTTRTTFGGSDPRDYLEETPANAILFAGYGFAKDYRQARGHVWAVEDVTHTGRLSAKTPATCWTCKSPDVLRLLDQMAPEDFYARPFAAFQLPPAGSATSEQAITHPIGCLDCHDPATMRLRVSRPALREAFARQGRDIDQVSHQEMRSLVCAQCHVEYYFKGPGNYLTFPWDNGLQLEQIESYYEQAEFSDWKHAISQAPMLKMQHPDYELYTTGIHAYRDVACADCHMPYRTEGGVKFTDHYIQSPLRNIANSCAVCHRWGEKEIEERVVAIQRKVRQGRDWAERALVEAHFDIAAAVQAGAADAELEEARRWVRRAQMRWDFVAAQNGMGFHAPQESMRVLQAAVDLAGRARLEAARILARHGVTEPVQYPDCSTRQQAQAILAAFQEGKPPRLVRKP